MAVEEFTVLYDLQHDGAGYDAIASGTKKKKGESIPAFEPGENGLRGQVFAAKVCRVKAESAKEACEIAAELYGSRGGVAAGLKVANATFESV